ncbi:hypothetical protein [Anaerovorax odorimutans]|uniref:hypothetical protein n=1 Tax=Anaerovorax odorimutans TaxID=109327 RepID=UPI00042483EC|nr:hypothetical protein [Anaerovorax odorimutans]
MMIIEQLLFNLKDWWDVFLWTGAWYVIPVWILIELVISTIIIFYKKRKEICNDNWKNGYFKGLGYTALFLIVVRAFLNLFIMSITDTQLIWDRTSLLSFSLSSLFIVAFLSSAATVRVLVNFHSVRCTRAKVYLVLLSIPLAFFYSTAMFIMLF